jgi:hypothetical protein
VSGIKRLAEMKKGNALDQELAAFLEKTAREAFWSMDFFDAYIAALKRAPPIETWKPRSDEDHE